MGLRDNTIWQPASLYCIDQGCVKSLRLASWQISRRKQWISVGPSTNSYLQYVHEGHSWLLFLTYNRILYPLVLSYHKLWYMGDMLLRHHQDRCPSGLHSTCFRSLLYICVRALSVIVLESSLSHSMAMIHTCWHRWARTSGTWAVIWGFESPSHHQPSYPKLLWIPKGSAEQGLTKHLLIFICVSGMFFSSQSQIRGFF